MWIAAARGRATLAALGLAGFAGVLSARAPLVTFAALLTAVLVVVPITWLWTAVAVASVLQQISVEVGGLTVRPADVVGLAFAARMLLARDRVRFGWVEWVAVVFIGIQAMTSILHAADVFASLRAVGQLGIGVAVFLGVASGTGADRVVAFVRVFLAVTAGQALVGLAALASHQVFGTAFGVAPREELGGAVAVVGPAFEHGIFGSMCAVGAVAFFSLWREGSRLFGPLVTAAGFWLCLAGAVLSLSRGAWLALAVGLVVSLLVVPGRPLRSTARLLVLGAGISILVGAVVVVSGTGVPIRTDALAARTVSALDLERGTGALRAREWSTAIREAAPIFGNGTNSYGQRHVERLREGFAPAYLGNWAVRTYHDSGVVGLGLLVLVFGALLWPGRSLREAGGERAQATRALVAAGCVALVAYLATDALLLVWPWVLFGLIRACRRGSEGAVPL